jgi:hypothetical protein
VLEAPPRQLLAFSDKQAVIFNGYDLHAASRREMAVSIGKPVPATVRVERHEVARKKRKRRRLLSASSRLLFTLCPVDYVMSIRVVGRPAYAISADEVSLLKKGIRLAG